MADKHLFLSERHKPIGIIDIGSNSIRLVVYSGKMRTPIPIHNESYICAIGSELESTGRLNPPGIKKALDVLYRFKTLVNLMGVESLEVLGTAALRDAKDGKDFVKFVKKKTGLSIKILSGRQESERSAFGVLCGIPNADGLVADLGGGSLELVNIKNGKLAQHGTFPTGTLRLLQASNNNINQVSNILNRHIREKKWDSICAGRPLYAVGGSWRALARVCISHMDYPLQVLDNFTLSSNDFLDLLKFISNLSQASLENIKGISQARSIHLPIAASVLSKLINITDAERLIFSIYGMREGQFFKKLPKKLKLQDPMVSAAMNMCNSLGRDTRAGEEAFEWMSPIITSESKELTRLRSASCFLRDVCWLEHTDYRAEQAFLRALRMPFMGIEHQDRVTVALTLFYRYGEEKTEVINRACEILNSKRYFWSKTVGLCLRLSYALTGGNTGILPKTNLKIQNRNLFLFLPRKEKIFYSGIYEKRLHRLALHLSLKPIVKIN